MGGVGGESACGLGEVFDESGNQRPGRARPGSGCQKVERPPAGQEVFRGELVSGVGVDGVEHAWVSE